MRPSRAQSGLDHPSEWAQSVANMPLLVSANINGAAVMIAGKWVDMVLENAVARRGANERLV